MKRITTNVINIIMAAIFLLAAGCEDDNSLSKALALLYFGNNSLVKKCSIKEYPVTITPFSVESSQEGSQPTETSKEKEVVDDPSAIWTLFDSNTVSFYTASSSHKFNISFGKSINLNRIKIFGSTTYTMNVYIGSADDLVKIPSLCIDQSILKDGSWNILNADEPIKTESITLEIIPKGDTGISELEFWCEESVNVSDGSLNNNLENITTSESLKTAVTKSSDHVIEKSAFPNEVSISGTKEESASAQMHITLTNNPAVYKRAFIKYKAKNILASVGIERRINNLSWNGGYDIPIKEGTTPSTGWIDYFEEINPAWLISGDNVIDFRTNKADVSIRDLKLVLVSDNGWNHVVAASKSEAYDNDEATSSEIADVNDKLDIEFERSIEPESVMISLAKKTNAQVSIQFLSNNQWFLIKSNWTIDLSEMNPGWNLITLPPQVQTKALRFQIIPISQSSEESNKVKINEIRVCGSAVGDPNVQPRIIVSYPRNGEYYGRTAFIQGFVNSAYQAQIGIENKTAASQVQDNSFSLSLSKDDTRFSAQEDNTAWNPVANAIRLEYSVSNSINLTNNKLSTSSGSSTGTTGGTTGGTTTGGNSGYTTEVFPDSAKTITFGPITIEIPAGAVDEKITITVIPLSKSEVASLNPGMINVTYPAAGYRFLVNGKPHYTFRKPINISFTYSKSLLLQGQGDNDVFMYYYAEPQKTWKRLQRVNAASSQMSAKSVSSTTKIVSPMKSMLSTSGEGVVVSQTDHFTDIINATITVPEQPDPLLYNPNTIKEMKIGDPGEGVNLIEPPIANNKGDARLSYPIEVPQGRCGMQPEISVIYNSSNGNGWLGVGWDIPIRAISYDTTFGVPRYNSAHAQYDRYLLEGNQIAPIGNGQYQLRVEGEFKKIVRYGNDYNNFYWEVTDKNGKKYIYGQHDNARLKSYRDPGNIFMWCLERIIDINGNTINYHYILDTVNDSTKEQAIQIYLNNVTYTGTGNSDGPYSIVFKRDILNPDINTNGDTILRPNRPDSIINCRSGFKVITRYRLESIDVLFNGNPVRSYGFTYETGQFSKSRLVEMSQKGSDGSVFNSHKFQYYDDVKIDSNNVALSGFENEKKEYTNAEISTLNKVKGSSTSSNGYLGLTLTFPVFEKQNSVGITAGSDNRDTSQINAVIDIDGDGLLDLIYIQEREIFNNAEVGVFYKKNLGLAGNSYSFGEPQKIEFLSNKINNLGKENANSHTSGSQLHYDGYSVSSETSNGTATESSYFADVNGDGLYDFIQIKDSVSTIYYNHGINNGNLVFSNESPEGFAGDINGVTIPESNFEEKSQEELLATYHRDDPILMWQAPYSGRVRISGDVQLIQKSLLKGGTNEYKTDDGVRTSIQIKNNLLWSAAITSGNNNPITPTNVEAINVNAGDQIYFRVNSIYDGAFDVVSWDPVIEYVNADPGLVDENGLSQFRYEAISDFSLSGSKMASPSLMKGRVQIEGKLIKESTTSDDVYMKIVKTDVNGYSTDLYSYTVPGTYVGEIELPPLGNIEVNASDQLNCRLFSDTPIDWNKIIMNSKVTYTQIDGIDLITDENGNPLYFFNLLPNYEFFPIKDKEPYYPFVVPEGKTGNARITFSIAKSESLSVDMPDDYLANVAIAVKRNGLLLRKQKGVIQKIGNNEILLDFTMDLTTNDKLYFVCSSDKKDFERYVVFSQPKIYFDVDNVYDRNGNIINTGFDAITMVYKIDDVDHPFGGGYRSWYYARWNGEIDNLDPSKMVPVDPGSIPNLDDVNENNFEEVANIFSEQIKTFSQMTPNALDVIAPMVIDQIWTGLDNDCWIGRVHEPGNLSNYVFTLSSTRKIKKYILPDAERTALNFSTRGIPKISTMTNNPLAINHGKWGIISAGTDSKLKTDIVDINGDLYPDVITESGIKYTNADGSLDETSLPIETLDIRENISHDMSLNWSKSESPHAPRTWYSYMIYPFPTVDDFKYATSNTEITTQTGLAAIGKTITYKDFIDVNGDKLPDLLYLKKDTNDNERVMVRLNLGYGLGKEEVWSYDNDFRVSKTAASNYSTTETVLDKSSQGTGLAIGIAKSSKVVDYIDINGDGLPDRVEKDINDFLVINGIGTSKWMVRFNTGDRFSPFSYEWSGSDNKIPMSYTTLPNTRISYFVSRTYPIPILPEYGIIVNPGISGGSYNGGFTTQTIDINGDGLPDHVMIEDVEVGQNALNQPIMESRVYVHLNRCGKTNLLRTITRPLGGSIDLDYTRAGNTQNMPQSRWTLTKVTTHDGMGNSYETNYSYTDANGIVNGYYDRTERKFYGFDTLNETRPDNSYITRKFNNKNYYLNGFEISDELLDRKGGNLYIQNVFDYRCKYISNSIQFPYLNNKETHYYEGNNNISKFTVQNYTYDDYGNVLTFFDNGDSGTSDDLMTSIGYVYNTGKYIVGKPNQIVVTGNGKIYRKRTCEYDGNGNLKYVHHYSNSNGEATTSIDYYSNGNIQRITAPQNYHGNAYWREYSYDSDTNTQIVSIKDVFGYQSTVLYDLRYGKPISKTDINKNTTTYSYDNFGRISVIYGPYDIGSGTPTYQITYNINSLPAMAKAQNKSYQNGTQTIDVYNYIDGLGRTIQTKKSAEVNGAPTKVASGAVMFDSMGRIIQRGQSVITGNGESYSSVQMKNPTSFNYDEMGRVTKITYPDGATNTFSYGINNDFQFFTETTDPLGWKKYAAMDIRGRISSTQEGLAGATKYQYNSIGEMIEVKDAKGNTTRIVYDMLGRRTSIDNPDTGLVDYYYDQASVPRHELIQRKSALKSTEQKCKSEQFYCSEGIHDIKGENYGYFCSEEKGIIKERDKPEDRFELADDRSLSQEHGRKKTLRYNTACVTT